MIACGFVLGIYASRPVGGRLEAGDGAELGGDGAESLEVGLDRLERLLADRVEALVAVALQCHAVEAADAGLAVHELVEGGVLDLTLTADDPELGLEVLVVDLVDLGEDLLAPAAFRVCESERDEIELFGVVVLLGDPRLFVRDPGGARGLLGFDVEAVLADAAGDDEDDGGEKQVDGVDSHGDLRVGARQYTTKNANCQSKQGLGL